MRTVPINASPPGALLPQFSKNLLSCFKALIARLSLEVLLASPAFHKVTPRSILDCSSTSALLRLLLADSNSRVRINGVRLSCSRRISELSSSSFRYPCINSWKALRRGVMLPSPVSLLVETVRSKSNFCPKRVTRHQIRCFSTRKLQYSIHSPQVACSGEMWWLLSNWDRSLAIW